MNFQGVMGHEEFGSFVVEGAKDEVAIVLLLSKLGDVMCWRMANSSSAMKKVSIPSGWITSAKGYTLTYQFSLNELDFLQNATVTNWVDLEELVASQRILVRKEGDNDTDKAEEFMTKLKPSEGVSLRFIYSAAAQGAGINLDLVTVQVIV